MQKFILKQSSKKQLITLNLLFSVFLVILFSCKSEIQRANFDTQNYSKVYIHQDYFFSFKMPEDWEFLSNDNEISTVLKFTSNNRKINGYLKQYKYRKNSFTLKDAVTDYFAKKIKCDFKNIYFGKKNGIGYFLLSGIFRDVYPIVTIVFIKNEHLYELTTINSIDQEEIDNNLTAKLGKKLVKVSFSLFSQMSFNKNKKTRYRKRYGITVPCLKNWVFGSTSSEGEISAIGYKDKIILISLKLIQDMDNSSPTAILKKIKSYKFTFIKKMKSKNYRVIEKKEQIFNENAHLLLITNISTEIPNTPNKKTMSVVKKYFFSKGSKIFELLIIYSMKAINAGSRKEIDKIINNIKF